MAEELSQRIDSIERGYEYLLAYAAQGRREETGSEVRATLERMHAALENLGQLAGSVVSRGKHEIAPFLQAIERDASVARAAIGLVLNCASIGSLLVDNLNASVHVRALLTDMFLLEQAMKS